MTILESIFLGGIILNFVLVICNIIYTRGVYIYSQRVYEQFIDFKIESSNEFHRIRFTEKPICDIGTKYDEKFIVIMAKRFERQNIMIPPSKCSIVLGHEYNILNLATKETMYFGSNMSFSRFLKDNNLSISSSDEIKN